MAPAKPFFGYLLSPEDARKRSTDLRIDFSPPTLLDGIKTLLWLGISLLAAIVLAVIA